MQKEFYPNVEYNRKRRNKYYTLLIVLTLITLLMDAWFITSKQYFGLAVNIVIIVAFALLLPTTLKSNPVKRSPVVKLGDDVITVMDKRIEKDNVTKVVGIIYLGSVGNLVENRKFLEETAEGEPLLGMMGSLEVYYKTDKGGSPACAVIENVTEALAVFVKEGKVDYRLGYSLGKEYRNSKYNLKEFLSEMEEEKKKSAPQKSKVKDVI